MSSRGTWWVIGLSEESTAFSSADGEKTDHYFPPMGSGVSALLSSDVAQVCPRFIVADKIIAQVTTNTFPSSQNVEVRFGKGDVTDIRVQFAGGETGIKSATGRSQRSSGGRMVVTTNPETTSGSGDWYVKNWAVRLRVDDRVTG